jgi:hypothetical protein
MEADHNPRYASMVKDVTGLSPNTVRLSPFTLSLSKGSRGLRQAQPERIGLI